MPRSSKLLRAIASSAATVTVALAPALAAAQSRPEAKPQPNYRDAIVAQVEQDPITFHELELRALLTSEYRDLKNSGNRVAVRQSLEKTLELLIDEKILVVACRKEKLALTKEDEKNIEREVERAAEGYPGGIEDLKAHLKSIGVPYDFFIDCKRTNRLISRLIMKNVSRDIYVEPERIRKFYDEHKQEKYKTKPVIKLFKVDVYSDLGGARVPDEVKDLEKTWNKDHARKFADTIRDRLAQKPPSEWRGIVAAATMDASTAAKSDPIEIYPTERMADQGDIYAEVDKLEPGQVSPVVASKIGFHVVCLRERSPQGFLPFSEVQREIADRLRIEIWQERFKAYMTRMRNDAIVERHFPPE